MSKSYKTDPRTGEVIKSGVDLTSPSGVKYRLTPKMDISKGDRVKITHSPHYPVEGIVISAQFFIEDWTTYDGVYFIELRADNTNYIYWKQDQDGGKVLILAKAENEDQGNV